MVDSAARRERDVARTMELGGQKATLWVSVVAFLGFLVLPYAGGQPGFQVVFHTGDIGIERTPFDMIFSILLTVGVGVLTTLTVLTRRATPGLIAWMMVTVAAANCLFILWLRGSSEFNVQIGFVCGLVSAFLATFAYSFVALRRSPAQREAEQHARAQAGQLDAVGQLQNSASAAKQQEETPLLVDDRRAKAREAERRSTER